MLESTLPMVIGIASGKGGVGKTTVSVNLAMALAELGKKVLLLDADLGLANAQLALGVRSTANIGHVLRNERPLAEVIVDAAPGVRLIPGASGMRDLASLDESQVASVIHLLDDLEEPVDCLLVDIAAGIAPAVVSFLAACQRRFVVACDQPASIADAYGLLKIMTVEEGLDEIFLVPNMVQSQAQGRRLHAHMNDVAQRFLGTSLRYIGSIERDDAVQAAQERYTPVCRHAPTSAASRSFRQLASQVARLGPVPKPSGRIQFLVQRLLQRHAPGP